MGQGICRDTMLTTWHGWLYRVLLHGVTGHVTSRQISKSYVDLTKFLACSQTNPAAPKESRILTPKPSCAWKSEVCIAGKSEWRDRTRECISRIGHGHTCTFSDMSCMHVQQPHAADCIPIQAYRALNPHWLFFYSDSGG